MPLDDLALGLQRALDRLVRRLRLGAAPAPGRRRLLIVQIDGLSRAVLEEGMVQGRAPFLARLLRHRGYRLAPMSVGLPTSTPAFQMAAMYGVRPDIPGFHYHDKRRKADVYFPRGGDAANVEKVQAAGRRGIVTGGGAYGCVFTGGAASNLLTFAMIKRPSGAGLLCTVSKSIVLAWVLMKASLASVIELSRAALRIVADPLSVSTDGWKWLAIKIGISVWLRELFTLAVAHDLYGGVPTIYVNYLDYDVVAHAWGPRHRRAFRALRRDVLDPGGAPRTAAPEGRGRRFASGLKAYRAQRAPGVFQRFVNYLERDFPRVLGETPDVRERAGIRVISAGPNAFVYFLESEKPLTLERIEERFPALATSISSARGIGIVLVRSASGPLCFWRGRRYGLDELHTGPFAGRPDLDRVVEGIRDLMAMPSAGDLVIYGTNAPQGDVSFISEVGAHAGPSPDELQTFLIHPRDADVPSPITHPIQLYPYFVRYQPEGV